MDLETLAFWSIMSKILPDNVDDWFFNGKMKKFHVYNKSFTIRTIPIGMYMFVAWKTRGIWARRNDLDSNMFYEYISSLWSGVYWKSIGVETRLHKHTHIHKGIWTMLTVRKSYDLLALYLIYFLLFVGWYKQYGITLIPLRTSIVA